MPEQPDKLKAQAEEHEGLPTWPLIRRKRRGFEGWPVRAQYGSDRERSFLGAVAPGRYGVKVSGTIVTGPSSTHAQCLENIGRLPGPVVKRPASQRD